MHGRDDGYSDDTNRDDRYSRDDDQTGELPRVEPAATHGWTLEQRPTLDATSALPAQTGFQVPAGYRAGTRHDQRVRAPWWQRGRSAVAVLGAFLAVAGAGTVGWALISSDDDPAVALPPPARP